ncbi:hypothetical protein GGF32_009460 [Allomyces javanicus]|nr:hypothetical protein GGF32_009460 [Allomyces javanicus]
MHDEDDDMLDDNVPAVPPPPLPPNQWVYTHVALWQAPPSPTAPANHADIPDNGDELPSPAPHALAARRRAFRTLHAPSL